MNSVLTGSGLYKGTFTIHMQKSPYSYFWDHHLNYIIIYYVPGIPNIVVYTEYQQALSNNIFNFLKRKKLAKCPWHPYNHGGYGRKQNSEWCLCKCTHLSRNKTKEEGLIYRASKGMSGSNFPVWHPSNWYWWTTIPTMADTLWIGRPFGTTFCFYHNTCLRWMFKVQGDK